MNPNSGPDIDVKTLLALRQENDAVRLITERLKVKEMGPADHIRTKHEVKTWIEEVGGAKEAEAIILRARQRHLPSQSQQVRQTMHKSQDQRLD